MNRIPCVPMLIAHAEWANAFSCANDNLHRCRRFFFPEWITYHAHNEHTVRFFVSPRGAINFICRKEYISPIILYMFTYSSHSHTLNLQKEWDKSDENLKWKWVRECQCRVSTQSVSVYISVHSLRFLVDSVFSACFVAVSHSHFLHCRNECSRHTIEMNLTLLGDGTTGNRARLNVLPRWFCFMTTVNRRKILCVRRKCASVVCVCACAPINRRLHASHSFFAIPFIDLNFIWLWLQVRRYGMDKVSISHRYPFNIEQHSHPNHSFFNLIHTKCFHPNVIIEMVLISQFAPENKFIQFYVCTVQCTLCALFWISISPLPLLVHNW